MEAMGVLFIGRVQANRPSVMKTLEKRFPVTIAPNGKAGLNLARARAYQVVILDAASMRTPGDRICHELRDILRQTPIIHIHPGPRDDVRSGADAVLFQPVTARQLTGCIERLLRKQDEEIVVCGPLSINLGRRVLVVNGQETQLTPKQARLVEEFLRNPGLTLDRRTLMEKVWETDYLGDTRTLDVHIRWIREVIEADPSQPHFLITVRGVGYRLDVSTNEEAMVLDEAQPVLP